MINKEQQLWDSFKTGSWPCYTSLYNLYFKVLNNYGYKFTRDSFLIEDCIHDLFVKLWNNRENLGSPESVKNYLFKAFRNILFRKIQQRREVDELDENYPFLIELAFDHKIIAMEEEAELYNKIKAVIETLPSRQREIIHLRFYEGFSYNEVADVMGITVNSTYKLLYKALNQLQSSLKVSKLIVILSLVMLIKKAIPITGN